MGICPRKQLHLNLQWHPSALAVQARYALLGRINSPLKLAEQYTRVAMEKPNTRAIPTTRAFVSGQTSKPALSACHERRLYRNYGVRVAQLNSGHALCAMEDSQPTP